MLLLFSIAIFVGCLAAKGAKQCGPNEHWSSCSAHCQPTCNFGDKTPCYRNCVPGCVCNEGYVKDTIKTGMSSGAMEGKCIKPWECKKKTEEKCAQNEHMERCLANCQPTCRYPKRNIMPCVKMCTKGCVCNEGFVKDTMKEGMSTTAIEGKCIRQTECKNQPEQRCGQNEHLSHCGAYCQPTCKRPVVGVCPLICAQGCVCNKGYVRNTMNEGIGRVFEGKKCIRLTECKNEQQKCGAHAHYDQWSAHCQPTCKYPAVPLTCSYNKVPGCVCDDGYVKDTMQVVTGTSKIEGKCIRPTECKNEQQKCGARAHFDQCWAHCQPTCQSLDSTPCVKMCVKGCVCDKGYVKDAMKRKSGISPIEGKCVRPGQCKKQDNCNKICFSDQQCSNANCGNTCKRVIIVFGFCAVK